MHISQQTLAACLLQLLYCSSTFAIKKNIDGKIRIRLYRQSSKYFDEIPIEIGHTLFKESDGFNKTLPIVLIIHGMAMGADSPFVNGVVDAFVERQLHNDYNILALDMPELFENSLLNDFYIGVLSNVQPAGRKIGKFLNNVINYGLTVPENINLIGYSMGVQVAGYAARLVKEVFGEINYIAGLDPAGPGFHTLFGRASKLTHVSKEDAKTTHFFHTNSISCGTRDRVGTADFVFNNGGTQPGCFKDAFVASSGTFYTYLIRYVLDKRTSQDYGKNKALDCSHIRVPYLYIEALANPGNFIARHCATWDHFTSCECNSHETAPISFPPDLRAHGIYYLRTHAKSPFGMGSAGARCRRIIHPISKNGYHVEIIPKDPIITDTKDPLHNQKIKGVLIPKRRRHFKDDVNIHIINGIKKIEDFHSTPIVNEQTETETLKQNEENGSKMDYQNEEDLQDLGSTKHLD